MMNDEIDVRYSHVSDSLYRVFYVPHIHGMILSGDRMSNTTPNLDRMSNTTPNVDYM